MEVTRSYQKEPCQAPFLDRKAARETSRLIPVSTSDHTNMYSNRPTPAIQLRLYVIGLHKNGSMMLEEEPRISLREALESH